MDDRPLQTPPTLGRHEECKIRKSLAHRRPNQQIVPVVPFRTRGVRSPVHIRNPGVDIVWPRPEQSRTAEIVVAPRCPAKHVDVAHFLRLVVVILNCDTVPCELSSIRAVAPFDRVYPASCAYSAVIPGVAGTIVIVPFVAPGAQLPPVTRTNSPGPGAAASYGVDTRPPLVPFNQRI